MEITEKRLKELERAELKLTALENGGVDNWVYYEFALKEYSETIEKEEKHEALLEEIISILCDGAYEPSEIGAGFAFHDDACADVLKYLKKQNIKFED